MTAREETLAFLDKHQIPYRLIEHGAVYTMEECLSLPGIDPEITEDCKNVFLCNRQKTQYYLMLLPAGGAFRTSHVSRALSVSRLSFADPDMLPKLLHLHAGAVSPMGLIFDREKRVTLICDERVRAKEYIAFHPCDNTATVILRTEDFFGPFLRALDREALMVSPPGEDAIGGLNA